ncbi:MAG: peptide ABC transporter substrate-binding protein [Ktedonobacteraceae bacterium]
MGSRKKLIKTILPGFLCIMALLMAACGGSTATTTTNSTQASADKQVFILPESGVPDIATFDPGLSTDVPSVVAINMVFTGLVEPDNNGNVVGYLAQNWKVSADNLTYTFHLRPNLKFSDGSPLTSADVAFSIDRALQPATKSGTGPYYLRYLKDATALATGKIKTIIGDSITTPDASTVVLTAALPAAFFLDALTYPCSYVLEKSLVQKYGNTGFTDHLTEGGGDGPFKVQSYTHSKQIVFVPNPGYYGPQPKLQKVIFPFYKNSDTTYNAYLSGQLSETGVPIADYDTAKTRTDFKAVPQLWIDYYAMNYNIKPFDNIDIRQAFELAINKNVVVQAAWKNSLLPTNHIVPQGMPGYAANLTGVGGAGTQGDQTKAKSLFATGMQQEGWTSVSQVPAVTLTYSSAGNQAAKNEVSIIQQDWQNVLGISVKVEDIDFNKLLTDITSNNLQFWGIAWVTDYSDPQDWTTLQFDAGSGNNNMNYGQNKSSDATAQQAVQKQLEAADIDQNPTTRFAAYNAAEQSLVNDVAWLPMEQVTATYLIKPCVSGFVVDHQDLTPPNDWGNTFITTATPCATGA